MFILLDVVNKCNLRCVMCNYRTQANAPRMVMSRPDFERIADAVFPLSRQVNLSCGYEPFVLPQFLDYLAIALQYSIPKLTFVTNAILLDRSKAQRIVALGLPFMGVSVDGATKETYDSIRIGARFETLLENLQALAAAKRMMHVQTPRIQFNFVLLEKTIDEAPLVVELMSEFSPYKFVFIHPDYAAPPDSQRLRIEAVLRQTLAECVKRGVLFEEVPSFCLTLEEIMQAYGCDVADVPKAVDGCTDPWHFMRIAPSGDVLMCPTIGRSAGNILHAHAMDIWHGEAYSNLRAQLQQGAPPVECQSCAYANTGLVQFRHLRDRMEHLIMQRMLAGAGREESRHDIPSARASHL